MANFAAQIKDKFLGLVDRVAGYGRSIGGEKEKALQEPGNNKLHSVQRVEVRSRGAEPVVGEGSTAGAN